MGHPVKANLNQLSIIMYIETIMITRQKGYDFTSFRIYQYMYIYTVYIVQEIPVPAVHVYIMNLVQEIPEYAEHVYVMYIQH